MTFPTLAIATVAVVATLAGPSRADTTVRITNQSQSSLYALVDGGAERTLGSLTVINLLSGQVLSLHRRPGMAGPSVKICQDYRAEPNGPAQQTITIADMPARGGTAGTPRCSFY